MTARTIGGILLKLLAIAWLYQAVIDAITVLPLVRGGVELDVRDVVTTSLTLAIPVLLLVFERRISRVLWPDSEPLVVDADAGDLFAVLAAVVGLYLVILAVAQLAGLTLEIVARPTWDEQERFEYLYTSRYVESLVTVVRGGLGAALVLGRRGIAAFWRRARPMRPTE